VYTTAGLTDVPFISANKGYIRVRFAHKWPHWVAIFVLVLVCFSCLHLYCCCCISSSQLYRVTVYCWADTVLSCIEVRIFCCYVSSCFVL